MSLNIFQKKPTCGPFNESLKINEACVNIFSNFNVDLSFYIKSTECFKCDYTLQGLPVLQNTETSFIIDTNFGTESYFYSGSDKFCEMTNHFEDFGVYNWNISESDCNDITLIQKPENLWINVSLSSCLFLGVFLASWLCRFMFKQCQMYFSSTVITFRELELDLGNLNREERKHRSRRQSRIKSIDAFRGLAIVLMIFVNYGGGDYSVFKHSPWNGLTIADLVFPWFVWIMGASIVFSLRSSLRMSTTKRKIFFHILKRSVFLICLGIMLNSGKRDNHSLRVCGVLQRMGVTYFVVAVIEIFIAKPQRTEQINSFGPWSYCQDIINSWIQWVIAIFCAVVHGLVTFLLEVPGCPTGYLGAGGFSEHSKYRNCTGGAAGYIDRLIITEDHMYHHGTFMKIYKPPVFYDPEGLLGTLTSILCAFLGVHAGRIILSFENPNSRIRQWLLWALFTGILAGFLCSWTQNEGVIPVNKNLWSLSYVLTCSSLAFLILAFFYWLIDFTHIWKGYPLIYPGKRFRRFVENEMCDLPATLTDKAGMNAIVLYLGHSLLKEQLPWRWFPYTNTHLEILVMDISATVVWVIISYILHKENIFITL